VIIAAALVILIGLTTLLGLIFGDVETLAGTLPTGALALIFVRLAVIIAALTFVIGVLNLLFVNGLRILRGRTWSARLSSLVIFASFVITLFLYIADRALSLQALEQIQVPLESALASLLFFVLVYGGFRILRGRVTAARMLFVISVLLVLTASLPLDNATWLQSGLDWLLDVPVNAGARGILLGIALATIVTGTRILIGQDRSYGG
jgi:hypothetical protein